MLVAVVRFPPVPADRDGDFREWFAWSNDQLRDADGLTARRLLSGGDGAYVGLVEHDSAETFARMHASPVATEVQQRLHQVLEDGPQADLFEVVEAAVAGGCCGGHDGTSTAPGALEAPPSDGAGCCGGSDGQPVEGRSATAPPVSACC